MGKSRVVIKDRGWNAMMKNVAQLGEGDVVKVGILGDTASGGLHVPGGKLTVVEYAAVNEFGSSDGRIPERSFLRSTYDAMRAELEGDAAKLLVKVLDGKLTKAQALGILGAKLANAIKRRITDGEGIPPPNAPSTAARKAGAGKWNVRGRAQQVHGWGVRTLVDGGRLLNSITWSITTR